jgi:hypothetical protein
MASCRDNRKRAGVQDFGSNPGSFVLMDGRRTAQTRTQVAASVAIVEILTKMDGSKNLVDRQHI